jgi:hypothetical protein
MDEHFWLRDQFFFPLLGFCVGFISGFGVRAMISWYRERRQARKAWDRITTEPHESGDRPPLHSKTFERTTGLLAVFGTASALIGLIYLLAFLGD